MNNDHPFDTLPNQSQSTNPLESPSLFPEMSKVGLWQWDVETQTIDWNLGMYSIHDLSPASAPSSLPDRAALSLSCYAPEDRQGVLSLFERCLKTGEPYDFECSFTTTKDRRLWVRTMAHAMQKDGKIHKVIGCLLDLTDQKQNRERLHNESLRRMTLMNASRDGIAIINQRHEVVEANTRFAEMLGYSMEEVLTLHTWDFEGILNEEEIRSKFSDLAQTNILIETKHRRKDGLIFDVEVCIAGALVGGEPMVFTISRDISDRKKAEQLLRLSEEKFRLAFQTSPDPTVITRLADGKIIDVNKAFIENTGHTREEVVGKSATDFNFWSDIDHRTHMYAELVKYGIVRNMETTLLRGNGKPVPVLVSASVYDLNGQPHIYFSARSMEEQKATEGQLRASEERNRQILHTAMDGFCRVDQTGRILEVNNAYCLMTGYGAEELLRMSIRDLDSAMHNGKIQHNLQTIADIGQARFESQQRRKDGRIFDVEVSVKHQRTCAGAEFVSFLRDITENKQAERITEQLHDLSLQLSHANTVEETLQLALQSALAISGLDCGGIYVMNKHTGGLDLTVHHNLPSAILKEAYTIDAEDPRLALVRKGQATYMAHAELNSINRELDEIVKALAVVPILHHEEAIACLNIGSLSLGEIPLSIRPHLESLGIQAGGFLARSMMEKNLRESEARYSILFEHTPVAVWEMDFSPVKKECERVQASGVSDFSIHLSSHPEEVQRYANLARILHANQGSLAIFKSTDVDVLSNNRVKYFTQSSIEVWKNLFIALSEGKLSFQSEIPILDNDDQQHHLIMRMVVCPSGERDLSQVLVSFLDITERKQAEALRRESNEQMLALFNATNDSIILLDTDCRILAINHGGALRRNKLPEQLVGRSLCDCLPLPLAEVRKEKIKEIVLSGRPVSFEEEREGQYYFINMVGVYNDKDEIVQVASFSRDITERKYAEQLLHQFNRELHAINECRQALIHAEKEKDLLQNICRIICDEAGYSMAWVCLVEEDRGKSLFPIVWYDRENNHQNQIESLAQDYQDDRTPLRNALLTGQTMFVHDFAQGASNIKMKEAALLRGHRSSIYLPLKNETNEILGSLNIYSNRPNSFTRQETDLLESLAKDLAYGIGFLRVRAEQDRSILVNKARVDLIRFAHLHSSRELLKETLKAAETLTDSHICFYHNIQEEHEKAILQEWLTKNSGDISRAKDIQQYNKVTAAGVWIDCLQQRQPIIYNNFKSLSNWSNKEDDAEILRFLAVPIIRGEKIRAILAVGNKTSPYNQSDINIVYQLTDLAWEIVERKMEEDKREEVEAKFRQAQKMEAIGTLAGGIAHDFNNILSAIIGYTEMALDDAKAGIASPADMSQVLKAAERAKELVKQILTFSRKVEVSFKPLNLNKQIDQAIQLLSKTIPKMIRLETQLDRNNLWPINADANQIEQILLNLTVNAADAMSGEGCVTIRTGNVIVQQQDCITCGRNFSGPHVTLEVVDTGQGMDSETIKHIFEPFFTTKELGKGTGMGLSTVYGIVMSHGGHVTCESKPGKGTTFTIFFPAIAVNNDEGDVEQTSVLQQQIEGKGHILIVDDEEAITNLAARFLEKAGYSVTTADRGEKAIDIYRSKGQEVDLVIMDLNMPGLGGFKTLKELLAINPEVKVLIASGYATGGQISDSIDCGATEYIVKPFKQVELLAAVRRVLDAPSTPPGMKVSS